MKKKKKETENKEGESELWSKVPQLTKHQLPGLKEPKNVGLAKGLYREVLRILSWWPFLKSVQEMDLLRLGIIHSGFLSWVSGTLYSL